MGRKGGRDRRRLAAGAFVAQNRIVGLPQCDAYGIERPVKSDSPTKCPPARSLSRVVLAKREATGHAMGADTDNQPFLPETPVKPDRADPKSPQAATDLIAAPETPGEAARQSFNRMLHTFGVVFGARSPPVAKSDSVPTSAGWTAAPRSETEAKSYALSAQYASATQGIEDRRAQGCRRRRIACRRLVQGRCTEQFVVSPAPWTGTYCSPAPGGCEWRVWKPGRSSLLRCSVTCCMPACTLCPPLMTTIMKPSSVTAAISPLLAQPCFKAVPRLLYFLCHTERSEAESRDLLFLGIHKC